MVREALEAVQVVPPLEQEGVGDEAEPGRDQQLLTLGLLQHLLQLLLGHVAVALDLIGVGGPPPRPSSGRERRNVMTI